MNLRMATPAAMWLLVQGGRLMERTPQDFDLRAANPWALAFLVICTASEHYSGT